MSGYFKVSMAAARAIVDASDEPDLLAGYITVCAYAFGPNREVTAAGAKSIRQTIGCTDFRSKKVMRELLTFQADYSSPAGLLAPSGKKKANADVYNMERWEGAFAYLPSLLVERHPEHGSPVLRLLRAESPAAVIRDALLLLLHVYTVTDYAEWFGCPPDAMPYRTWESSGTAGDDFELGLQGKVGGLELWLVAEPQTETWHVSPEVIADLFGAAEDRFWDAWWCLLASGSIVPVISVQTKRTTYPLWIYSKGYRQTLAENHGVVADLGREAHLAACSSGLDPDNLVMRYAVDEMDRRGSGLFYCFGSPPKVLTVVVPRLHAPTPINLDGLQEAAAVTKGILKTIWAARKADRQAGVG